MINIMQALLFIKIAVEYPIPHSGTVGMKTASPKAIKCIVV
jgi:hypothetical protein